VRPGKAPALAAMTLAAFVALTTAGCGATNPPATTQARQAAHTGRPSPAGSVAAPSLTPRQRAHDDALAILKSFAVPPGSRRVQSPPLVSGGVLRQPAQTPAAQDLVDQAAWLIAPSTPGSVLGWEERHIPREFKLDGAVTTDGPPGVQPTLTDTFSLPPVAGVLDSRQLLVEVVRDGDGTAIRVDAQVTWLPVRPASERIPARSATVTIALNLGLLHVKKRPPQPVTITDPAKVSQLAALINGLPLTAPGIKHCGNDIADNLTLTFRASPQGPPLAVAVANLSGCEGVGLTIGGKPQPGLDGVLPDGAAIALQILTTADLNWQVVILQ
jgi:hypothetical protein